MIRLLPFAGYFVGLTIPLYALTDYWAQFSERYDAALATGQILALGSLLLFWFFNVKRRQRPVDLRGIFFAAPFAAWSAASTLWSIAPATTVLNFVLFFFYISTTLIIWQLPFADFRRISLLGALTVMGALFPLPLILQIRDRTLGGVQPNLIGAYALLIMVLFFLHGRWKLWPALIAAFIIYFTQARTVFIGFALFSGTWFILNEYLVRMKKRINIIMPLLPVAGLAVLIYYNFRDDLIELISNVLNVTSSSRLGSDYTGRTEVWRVAASKIAARPLHGYGFRTRETADLTYITDAINAHSGQLNIVLDIGYIGLGFFVLWYGYALWKATDPRPHPMFAQRIVIAAFLVGNIPILIFEPNYISFANPTTFLTLLALGFSLDPDMAARPTSAQRRSPPGHQRYLRV